MVIVESYSIAVLMCIITMICWGSWANTQKLASKEWRFQLFYWDYCLGVLLLTLIFAFTLGSMGDHGRSFLADLRQAHGKFIGSPCLAAWCLTSRTSCLSPQSISRAWLSPFRWDRLGAGYRRFHVVSRGSVRQSGVAVHRRGLRGCRNRPRCFRVSAVTLEGAKNHRKRNRLVHSLRHTHVAVLSSSSKAMPKPLAQHRESGHGRQADSLHGAWYFLPLGLFLSSFVLNSLVMMKPFVGEPVPFGDYFKKGTPWLHAVGILGGMIWGVGMSFAIISGDRAGYAISYGLGQGATMVAAFWGVFIWKEFKNAKPGTNKLARAHVRFVHRGVGIDCPREHDTDCQHVIIRN